MPREQRDEIRLTVEVRPRASRDEVVAGDGTVVRLRVTAPPVAGAANEAVRALLARTLGCPRAAVQILRGEGSRTKLVRVVGLTPAELETRLRANG